MGQVLWTPVAESDLDEILFFIALVERSPVTAERIYFEIRDRISEYSGGTLPGHRHPDAPQDWLYFRHKRWLVFYRLLENGIEVLRVIDGVRDLPRQLRDN